MGVFCARYGTVYMLNSQVRGTRVSDLVTAMGLPPREQLSDIVSKSDKMSVGKGERTSSVPGNSIISGGRGGLL